MAHRPTGQLCQISRLWAQETIHLVSPFTCLAICLSGIGLVGVELSLLSSPSPPISLTRTLVLSEEGNISIFLQLWLEYTRDPHFLGSWCDHRLSHWTSGYMQRQQIKPPSDLNQLDTRPSVASSAARRFVSLLPFQRRPSVGEQRLQSWNSPHAFLSAGRGDASDHALLLCSLLLGFGLDALVCIGRVVQPSEAEGEGERGGGRIDGQESGSAEETSHFVSL